MKKMILTLSLLFSVTAMADIPMSGTKIKTTNIEGPAAKKVYIHMKGQTIAGNSLRGYTSTYRVERSDDGRQQTVCEKIEYRYGDKADEFSCTHKEVIGKKGTVPRFIVHRRLG